MQNSVDTPSNEIQQMGTQFRAAAEDVDKLSEEAREAQIGVTFLGRSIFKTSTEAKRFGGVFQSADGRLDVSSD